MAPQSSRPYDPLRRVALSDMSAFMMMVVLGTALGFLSGLGTGGGSLLILWLTLAENMPVTDARAINLLFFIPSALIACMFRWQQGRLEVRKILPAILAGITAGTVTSLAFVFALCRLFSLDTAVTVSLLPKFVTAAIGVPLTQMGGGLSPIATTAIILTGILGSLLGPVFCKLFRLKKETAIGVAFGTSAHVIGTTKANDLSPLAGAVSSLSLAVAGILTAFVFPLILLLI